ncbi:MAG: DJ-1/PfpI family protein [Synergistaceae bacterium]|jgi:transcriptional regulator GlxA family with amidase domain|nr:DJ-1/PfpI family protein [Synergistaceae bacterium]
MMNHPKEPVSDTPCPKSPHLDSVRVDLVRFNILLFDGFETLDACGPAEIAGKAPDRYRLGYYSMRGGVVTSAQKLEACTRPLEEMSPGVLLIPGGEGTRTLVDDAGFIERLRRAALEATVVLTVCTGASLLAKTNLMDGKNATTNKIAFDWVASLNPRVNWIRRGRWVQDGALFSSSGVSAGMDMTLAFIAEDRGVEEAERIAGRIEYLWNRHPDDDPFAIS